MTNRYKLCILTQNPSQDILSNTRYTLSPSIKILNLQAATAISPATSALLFYAKTLHFEAKMAIFAACFSEGAPSAPANWELVLTCGPPCRVSLQQLFKMKFGARLENMSVLVHCVLYYGPITSSLDYLL